MRPNLARSITRMMRPPATRRRSMSIPATSRGMWRFIGAVKRLLESEMWPADHVIFVVLAADEAIANAIRHGCGGDPGKRIRCIARLDESGNLAIIIRDPGPGFDPTKVPDPTQGDALLASNGRGLFLIRQLMDEVAFADGGREIHMRKRRAAAPDLA